MPLKSGDLAHDGNQWQMDNRRRLRSELGCEGQISGIRALGVVAWRQYRNGGVPSATAEELAGTNVWCERLTRRPNINIL